MDRPGHGPVKPEKKTEHGNAAEDEASPGLQVVDIFPRRFRQPPEVLQLGFDAGYRILDLQQDRRGEFIAQRVRTGCRRRLMGRAIPIRLWCVCPFHDETFGVTRSFVEHWKVAHNGTI
ncbi:hypothetical protein [Luteibacter yeojuensis]|uniref:hypothetical protein n=1 Tax=Luteibacter yeojuensis TaxID=345309 RepID=UPI0012EE6830|nr:hypothetical protein [Luteibacter yeojuensis]